MDFECAKLVTMHDVPRDGVAQATQGLIFQGTYRATSRDFSDREKIDARARARGRSTDRDEMEICVTRHVQNTYRVHTQCIFLFQSNAILLYVPSATQHPLMLDETA